MIRDCILFERPFILENEADLLKHGTILYCISPLSILNHNANIKTLKYLSKEIYTIDQTLMSIEIARSNPISKYFSKLNQRFI